MMWSRWPVPHARQWVCLSVNMERIWIGQPCRHLANLNIATGDQRFNMKEQIKIEGQQEYDWALPIMGFSSYHDSLYWLFYI